MAQAKFFPLMVAAISCLILFDIVQGEIIATSILFRHGQRTPHIIAPNIPCSLCDELGAGQLTNAGSRDLYDTGLMLRLKYLNLFPDGGFFRMSNMRIVSSASERCVMSLQSFMAGFNPPPILDWNLPVFFQPFYFEIDYEGKIVYLNPDMSACPAYFNKLFGNVMEPNEEYTAWLTADKAVLEDTAIRSGIPISNLIDVQQVAEMMKAQMIIDPNYPQWAKDVFASTFQKYLSLMRTLFHSTEQMIKTRGGPMVTEMLKNMEAIANGDPTGKKLFLLSAHDQTIVSLAYALKVEDQLPHLISYNDAIMVDLVKNGSGEPTVEVIYMDNANAIPKTFKLNMPGCGVSCTLSTFRNVVKDVLVTDWDTLCGV